MTDEDRVANKTVVYLRQVMPEARTKAAQEVYAHGPFDEGDLIHKMIRLSESLAYEGASYEDVRRLTAYGLLYMAVFAINHEGELHA